VTAREAVNLIDEECTKRLADIIANRLLDVAKQEFRGTCLLQNVATTPGGKRISITVEQRSCIVDIGTDPVIHCRRDDIKGEIHVPIERTFRPPSGPPHPDRIRLIRRGSKRLI